MTDDHWEGDDALPQPVRPGEARALVDAYRRATEAETTIRQLLTQAGISPSDFTLTATVDIDGRPAGPAHREAAGSALTPPRAKTLRLRPAHPRSPTQKAPMNYCWLDSPTNSGRRGNRPPPAPAPTGHHRNSHRTTATGSAPRRLTWAKVIGRLLARWAAPSLTWPPRRTAQDRGPTVGATGRRADPAMAAIDDDIPRTHDQVADE